MPGYFGSQKQKLKEKSVPMKKFNRRGKANVSCRSSAQLGKEGADVSANINENLNSNKADSSPCFQSQNWACKDNTINPITSEHIFRDLDTHENSQNDGMGCDVNEEQVDLTSSPFGLGLKSPKNDIPVVKPSLVRETAVKWVRATRSIIQSDDLAQTTNLGKRNAKALVCKHSEAKCRPRKSENAFSQTCPTAEAIQ